MTEKKRPHPERTRAASGQLFSIRKFGGHFARFIIRCTGNAKRLREPSRARNLACRQSCKLGFFILSHAV